MNTKADKHEKLNKDILVSFLTKNEPLNPSWQLTDIDKADARHLKMLLSQAFFVSLNKHGKTMCKQLGEHVKDTVKSVASGVGVKNVDNVFQILYQRKQGIHERHGFIWSLALNSLIKDMKVFKDLDVKDAICVYHKSTEVVGLLPSYIDEDNAIPNLVILDSHNEKLFFRLMMEGGINNYESTGHNTYKMFLNDKGMRFVNKQTGNINIRVLSSELSDEDYTDTPKET